MAIKLILRNFAPVIKSNMAAPPVSVGVDLVREERWVKNLSKFVVLNNFVKQFLVHSFAVICRLTRHSCPICTLSLLSWVSPDPSKSTHLPECSGHDNYNAKGVSMSTSGNQILGPCNLSTPFNPKHFPQKWLPLVCLDRLLISTWSLPQDMSTSVIHCISFHVMIVSKSSMTYFQKVDSSLYCQPDFILVK